MSTPQIETRANEVTRMDVAAILPDPKNLRRHPKRQIDHLCRSIEEFGFNDPIGVDERGVIIEGHARLEAAKRLGMKDVPVIVLSGMTDEERIGYGIAHNQTGVNTGLDEDVVREELTRVAVKESDFASLGFGQEEMMFVMTPLPDDTAKQDHNGHEVSDFNSFLPKVHRTRIAFASEEDFDVWTDFLMTITGKYLDAATIAERLMRFLDDYWTEDDERTEPEG